MAENWIFLWDLPKSLKVPRIYLVGLVMMHKLTHVNIVRDNFICLLWQKRFHYFMRSFNNSRNLVTWCKSYFETQSPLFPVPTLLLPGVAGVIVSSASLRPVLPHCHLVHRVQGKEREDQGHRTQLRSKE